MSGCVVGGRANLREQVERKSLTKKVIVNFFLGHPKMEGVYLVRDGSRNILEDILDMISYTVV